MCALWLNGPLYSNPMRRFGETIKYNYISLITHSSARETVTVNKAFHCLTVSYSLLFISFAFSHLGGIYLVSFGPLGVAIVKFAPFCTNSLVFFFKYICRLVNRRWQKLIIPMECVQLLSLVINMLYSFLFQQYFFQASCKIATKWIRKALQYNNLFPLFILHFHTVLFHIK